MVGSKLNIKKEHKTKGNYCFPNFLGNFMRSISPRVQFEASLLSITLILLGIIILTFATIFGTDLSVFIKIMTAVNCGAAFIFLSSHLITTFQQYQGYLNVMGLLHSIKEDTILKDKLTNKKEEDKDEDKVT